MTNNDIIRQLRYIFDYSDDKMMELFASGQLETTRAQVCDWLKKEDDEAYLKIEDKELAAFLNGLIQEKRGKKEGVQMRPEDRLNNNIILRKLKIALKLQDDDLLTIFDLA